MKSAGLLREPQLHPDSLERAEGVGHVAVAVVAAVVAVAVAAVAAGVAAAADRMESQGRTRSCMKGALSTALQRHSSGSRTAFSYLATTHLQSHRI